MDALALCGDSIPFYRYGNNIQDHIEVTAGERTPEQLSLTPQPRVFLPNSPFPWVGEAVAGGGDTFPG